MEDQLILLEGQSKPVPAIPEGFYKNKPRPNGQSDEVLAIVANGLMPEILRWGSWEENDREVQEVAEQILEVMEISRDGYKMAKALEDRHGWDGDADLVDILEGADFYGAERTAVLAWIRDNDVTPAFEVGKQVKIKVGREKTVHDGEIVTVTEDGNYCVMVPELGHVRKGLGTHGLLYAWEVVEEWNSAA